MARAKAPMDGSEWPSGDPGPLFRRTDPDTSREAAEKVRPHLSHLQAAVMAEFDRHGDMTAAEAEALTVFQLCKPSTVRKRCTDLVRMGSLEPTGEKRDGCRVLRVKEG